ncbi:MAG: amidohydrolase family protein [Desulfobacterales bacterium]
MLTSSLAALNDPEGPRVPAGLPPVVDAHVHIFPHAVWAAVWQWFDTHAWPIRYRLGTPELLEFLLARGVAHVIALLYAHKPGISRDLNRYAALRCGVFGDRVTALATVFPGEPEVPAILREAFGLGLKGVKLHAHVQCFDMHSAALDAVCQICADEGKPLVIHAGREPSSPAYRCDPHQTCSAAKVARLLENFPRLRLCVPHLGADEFRAYQRLLERHDTLWLDTAMALTDYLPFENPVKLQDLRPDRVMYGSDFPNLPYAWDRELKWLERAGLKDDHLKALLGGNARDFLGIGASGADRRGPGGPKS